MDDGRFAEVGLESVLDRTFVASVSAASEVDVGALSDCGEAGSLMARTTRRPKRVNRYVEAKESQAAAAKEGTDATVLCTKHAPHGTESGFGREARPRMGMLVKRNVRAQRRECSPREHSPQDEEEERGCNRVAEQTSISVNTYQC